ncbi:nitroreductase family protein [Candidatus Woesearchaeota archaeon]|nr:nitroreductase family protein [Candidatus Woesearchaeota archaeon]
METLECIKQRRSVRKFSDIPVKWDDITQIVDTVRYAPTSGNLQNFKCVVVMDKGKIKKIAEECAKQQWLQTAPVVIVLCADVEKAKKFYGIRGERLYATQNVAAATQNILLACCDIGLAGCWVGAFNEEAIKRILGIPGSVRPQVIIPIGYAAEKPRDLPKYRLNDLFYIDSYGNKVFDWNEYMGWSSVKIEKTLKEAAETLKTGVKKAIEKISDKVKNKEEKQEV